jgi:hypothetical protein
MFLIATQRILSIVDTNTNKVKFKVAGWLSHEKQ